MHLQEYAAAAPANHDSADDDAANHGPANHGPAHDGLANPVAHGNKDAAARSGAKAGNRHLASDGLTRGATP